MELHELCEAAITGDIASLHNIVGKNSLILHKLAAGCFNGAASPLHVATISKQTDFVKALLSLKPELKLRLTEVLDSQLRSALHLASAMGNVEIVKELLEANPKMCLVLNRDGKTPLHVAAMGDNIEVLEELVKASPQAARVRVDQNDTIFHLCVKHNQLENLKKLLAIIQDRDFVNAKDIDGNTILHLAFLYNHLEITSHILEKKVLDVNATNASGHTAMDLLFVDANTPKTEVLEPFEDILRQANAEREKDLLHGDWLAKKRDSLMIVASLIATMAFQAAVSPPGGVWQDNDGNVAGESVMAYQHKSSYQFFLRFNTVGFIASLSTILLLISGLKFKNKAIVWTLMVTMWLAIASIATTYAFATFVVTPKKDLRSLSHTIEIGVIVWSGVMALLLLNHTYNLVRIVVKEKRSRNQAIRRITGFKPQSLVDAFPFVRYIIRGNTEGVTPAIPRTPTSRC